MRPSHVSPPFFLPPPPYADADHFFSSLLFFCRVADTIVGASLGVRGVLRTSFYAFCGTPVTASSFSVAAGAFVRAPRFHGSGNSWFRVVCLCRPLLVSSIRTFWARRHLPSGSSSSVASPISSRILSVRNICHFYPDASPSVPGYFALLPNVSSAIAVPYFCLGCIHLLHPRFLSQRIWCFRCACLDSVCLGTTTSLYD